MVLKTTLCRFSGLRIYPGRGVVFVRIDGQQFLFLSKKCRSLFNNRLRPAKLAWTAAYRKAHKKDQVSEGTRRKRRNNGKNATRSIVGASMELLQRKRAEKPEVRQATRDAALREVKDRAKKAKETKAKAGNSKAPAAKVAQNVGRGKQVVGGKR
eukprot:gene1718-33125_t